MLWHISISGQKKIDGLLEKDDIKNSCIDKAYRKAYLIIEKAIFLITLDGGACTAKLGLVTKKRKLSKTFLYFYSHF